ncbi:hypothetical protein Cni_G20430 [Canna indica]|uniref:Uncharacterized protein n=1 Tax=Canna indica TaxID=4628 RepID=A0AAQ3KT83_9LILI|nr:hypothetical protein Cni_G20430 [Canna indica]
MATNAQRVFASTSRDKLITVVPLDHRAGGGHHRRSSAIPSSPSPGGLLCSLFVSLTTQRSPIASSSTAIHED